MFRPESIGPVAAALAFAIVLWGGNNVGTKILVGAWPPIWTGASRFLCAGLLLLALLRWTRWLGVPHALSAPMRRALWLRGGLVLAAYVAVFNWALRGTSPAHVALYLGAAPVWALLWETAEDSRRLTVRQVLAAVLALSGVAILLWPVLHATSIQLTGEALGLGASVLWVAYGRQCRQLTTELGGAEVTAQSMWRAGVWLTPVGLLEISQSRLPLNWQLLGIQTYCVLAGGVVAFAIWNNALRVWPTSQVLLFNNLIPISTMIWSYFWLEESVTSTFWVALLLVAAGVGLGLFKTAPKPMLTSLSQPE